MSDLTMQPPKWGSAELLPLPKRYNSAIRDLVRERITASDVPWSELVLDPEIALFSRADAEAIEKVVLDEGYRFEFSATASLESEPEKYKLPDKMAATDEPEADVIDGRRQVGTGDNVILKDAPLSGQVAFVSTIEQVMDLLTEGVPNGTIAVIDDSGGTLTAPILEAFAGVICLGGTVRSHLGILAREYDVPTLMNCHVANLVDGDTVEIEVTAAPPAADSYETGDTGHARIWKIEGNRR